MNDKIFIDMLGEKYGLFGSENSDNLFIAKI